MYLSRVNLYVLVAIAFLAVSIFICIICVVSVAFNCLHAAIKKKEKEKYLLINSNRIVCVLSSSSLFSSSTILNILFIRL